MYYYCADMYMGRYVFFLFVISLIAILVHSKRNLLLQSGGEYCDCNPTGLDTKRCPPIHCKKPGFTVQAYTCTDERGTRGSYIGTYNYTNTIDFDWGLTAPILETGRSDGVYLVLTFMLLSPLTGTLQLGLSSDDGSELDFDGKTVVSMWKSQAATFTGSGNLTVTKGAYYPIEIRYYEAGGAASLKFQWKYDNIDWTTVPGANIFSQQADDKALKPPPAPAPAPVWSQITGSLMNVSQGPEWTWGVNKSGAVFRCPTPCNGNWTQVPGSLTQVKAGKKEVWGVNSSDSIFKTSPDSTGNWAQVPGSLTNVSVGPDGTVWGVNRTGAIFTCPAGCTGQWKQVDGNLKQIDVGEDVVVGVNSNNDIWTRPTNGSGQWEQIPGKLSWVSTGKRWLYGTGANGDIYRCKKPCKAGNLDWIKVDGFLKQIDVGETGVVGVNIHDAIFKRGLDPL